MNVGICIEHSTGNMRERIENAISLGIRHAQLISWNSANWTDESAQEINALVKELDFTFTAFWCGWCGPKFWNFTEGPQTLGLVPVEYRHLRMNDMLNGAAFAKKIGVNDIITHMGFIPCLPNDPNYPGFLAAVKFLARSYKRDGQNLLFETGQETPVCLLRLIEDVGTGNLFVNLDPANLVMYGMANPVDALDVFGDYVRGVHAKDGKYPTNGRELGPEVKVGTGKVDYPKLIEGLKAHGFDGSLTIEREISGEQQIIDIKDTKKYLEELIHA